MVTLKECQVTLKGVDVTLKVYAEGVPSHSKVVDVTLKVFRATLKGSMLRWRIARTPFSVTSTSSE